MDLGRLGSVRETQFADVQVHTMQTFQSLELALEAAEALGPDHYVIDRHGLQIWNQQRKLLRDEE